GGRGRPQGGPPRGSTHSATTAPPAPPNTMETRHFRMGLNWFTNGRTGVEGPANSQKLRQGGGPMWRIAGLAIALTVLADILAAAAAEDYPTRTVKIIVPFGAGGPADLYARFLGQH